MLLGQPTQLPLNKLNHSTLLLLLLLLPEPLITTSIKCYTVPDFPTDNGEEVSERKNVLETSMNLCQGITKTKLSGKNTGWSSFHHSEGSLGELRVHVYVRAPLKQVAH